MLLTRYRTIQPVIQKETIQPSVVHTTVPIHEVHENEAKHHSATALPAVSMADFKKQGGSLTGREERYDGFEGEPKAVGSSLGGSTGTGIGHHDSSHVGGHHGSSNVGPHSSNLGNRADPRVDSDMSRDTTGSGYGNTSGTGYGSGNTGTSGTGYGSGNTGTSGTGYGSGNTGTSGTGYGSGNTGTSGTGYGSNTSDTTGSSTGKKPSLMDRLNRGLLFPLKSYHRVANQFQR